MVESLFFMFHQHMAAKVCIWQERVSVSSFQRRSSIGSWAQAPLLVIDGGSVQHMPMCKELERDDFEFENVQHGRGGLHELHEFTANVV